MEGIQERVKCQALSVLQKDFTDTSRYFGKLQELYKHANLALWGVRELINIFYISDRQGAITHLTERWKYVPQYSFALFFGFKCGEASHVFNKR